MSKHLLARHCRLVTDDLDLARERLGRLWERHQCQLRNGRRFGIRWHQADFAHTAITYVRNFGAFSVQTGPVSDVFRVIMPESGRIHRWANGRAAVSTTSSAGMQVPGRELRLEIEPSRILILGSHGSYVRKISATRLGVAAPIERWPLEFSLQSPPVAALHSLTRWMACELDQPNTPLRSSHTAANLERTLLAMFLQCVEANLPIDERTAEDLASQQLKRVEELLDCHFTNPVGIEEMAQVAGVSVRSVQNAFRRLRGCTPTEAILQRRLQHARRGLLSAEPGTSVTTVALEAGFFHLGRFAARYARVFGESPSQTLARRRQLK